VTKNFTPPQSDLDAIEQWALDRGLNPNAIYSDDNEPLKDSEGYREQGYAILQDMFDYIDDGGFDSLAVFWWDEKRRLWRVFVDY